MKKRMYILLVLACLFVVACSSEPGGQGAGELLEETDLSKIGNGEKILKNIGANTEITLSNFSLKDGIIVEVRDKVKGIANIRKTADSNNNMYKNPGNKYFMIIPDEDGTASFTGADLGIESAGGGEIAIRKYKNEGAGGNDFLISKAEYEIKNGSKEEYYYFDFKTSHLDPSKIVIVDCGDNGNPSRDIVQLGLDNSKLLYNQVYDFSDYDGIGIFSYTNFPESGRDDYWIGTFVTNPQELTLEKNLQIQGVISVVEIPYNSGDSYRITMKFDEWDDELVAQLLRFRVRDLKGYSQSMFYPETIDPESKTISLLTGPIEKEVLFTLDASKTIKSSPVTSEDLIGKLNNNNKITLKLEKTDVNPVFIDLVNNPDYVVKSNGTCGYTTLAFKIADKVTLDVAGGDFRNSVHEIGVSNVVGQDARSGDYGSRPIFPNKHDTLDLGMDDKRTSTGFIVYRYSNVAEGDTICTYSKKSDYYQHKHIKTSDTDKKQWYDVDTGKEIDFELTMFSKSLKEELRAYSGSTEREFGSYGKIVLEGISITPQTSKYELSGISSIGNTIRNNRLGVYRSNNNPKVRVYYEYKEIILDDLGQAGENVVVKVRGDLYIWEGLETTDDFDLPETPINGDTWDWETSQPKGCVMFSDVWFSIPEE